MVDPAPTVSVTIVLHNSADGLPACLSSLRAELDDGFAELVAVDNASPDESVAIVEREAPTAHVVRATRNAGFAAGANLAWPRVSGRYWLLLNPDAELEPGALRTLVAWMDDHPAVGIASAELHDPAGTGLRRSGRALPSAARMLLEASRLHRLLPTGVRGRLLRGAYWRGGDQLDVGWVPGTAMIARREAVRSVGLLDDRFFLYGEDLEWCWRMRRFGWRIGVCSSARVVHRESTSVVETFGGAAVAARMVDGELRAVCAARGRGHARVYGLATALALWIESRHPGRESGHRERARSAARTWVSTVRELGR